LSFLKLDHLFDLRAGRHDIKGQVPHVNNASPLLILEISAVFREQILLGFVAGRENSKTLRVFFQDFVEGDPMGDVQVVLHEGGFGAFQKEGVDAQPVLLGSFLSNKTS